MSNTPVASKSIISDPIRIACWALALALGSIFLVEAWLSLEWRMATDSPLLHYVAFLIDKHDFVPYRDVFETSMPGTFLFHLAIVKLVGYSEFAFRLVDIAMLMLAMLLLWLTARKINTLTATIGVLAVAVLYLGYAMDLQRDWFGFIAVLAAMLAATTHFRPRFSGAAIIGFCCGLAAIVKPHLAIGGPVLLLYHTLYVQRSSRHSLLADLVAQFAVAGIALALVIAMPLLWLWNNGGLAAFWEMLSSYLPLHVDMTGAIETVTPAEKLQYFKKKLTYDLPYWVIPAALGVGVALRGGELDAARKRLVYLFVALAVCYIVYTILASQFWPYHWLPFRTLAIMCSALMLLPLRRIKAPVFFEAILLLFFCICVTVWTNTLDLYRYRIVPPYAFRAQLQGEPPPLRKDGRVDEIAAFLRAAKLGPEDRVQPLDWTEGALHGMLLAEAIIATPYLYNYHFYHYISNPYIQLIRQRFMADLMQAPPRFIIETDDELRPSGLDTTDSFPELEAFVQQHYAVAKSGKLYRIYEYQPTAP